MPVAPKARAVVRQTVEHLKSDVAESLGLEPSLPPATTKTPASPKTPSSTSLPKASTTNDAAKMTQIRQNIARINQEIEKVRQEKETARQQDQVKTEQKQMAKLEEKKKDSVLTKLIKSRKGTKEGMQRASG